MKAVDTNVLVHAHREDSPFHRRAYDVVATLAEGRSAWALPWPCLHEFLAVVTHPRIFDPPTPLDVALAQIGAWLESPSVVVMAEGPGYFDTLAALATDGRVAGPLVHDARVAAMCRYHGVDELLSADRDFGRFPGLRVTNPLVGS